MRELLNQIEESLNHKFYYLSLITALTVPDIAAKLESTVKEEVGVRYTRWFNTYVRHQTSKRINKKFNLSLPLKLSQLTGEDCYYFRCSLLHEGSSESQRSSYKKILFVEPDTCNFKGHDCTQTSESGTYLLIDVKEFCIDIIEGTKEWLDKVEETEPYKTNYEKFIRRYPNGYPPIVIGCPVIG
ncbi:hypothetical protein H6G33_38195 [Calothrix sp. FACHB-1219]|uniref:hypothetical protein n=1 Tax=unclassified Calothrix TaxID=2619626 RepID=UPI001683F038|nr:MULTISPECIES: hypothetical protein [unclassified Calothrix]MBD2208213.1 hypothetical protein [Calothrix sp. FACHB-168]MBD2222751.1 hypothetical protein [Calothrix sp. FACHB-1219]